MDKELFDRELNPTPSFERRLAHGLPNAPAENMTFQQLYDILSELYASLGHNHSNYAETSAIPGASWANLSSIESIITMYDYSLCKYGNIVTLSMRFKADSIISSTTNYNIAAIPIGYKPTSNVWGSIVNETTTDIERGVISINTSGIIYGNFGKSGKTWRVNLSWIII